MADTKSSFEKIEAIKQINYEIITRIKAKNGASIIFYSYELNNAKLEIEEKKHTQAIGPKISAWKPKKKLIVVEDIFNNQIKFEIKGFNDLERLNSELYKPVCQFKRFGDSAGVNPLLREYLANFETIQELLGELEQLTLGTPSNGSLERANQALNRFKKELTELNHGEILQAAFPYCTPREAKQELRDLDPKTPFVNAIEKQRKLLLAQCEPPVFLFAYQSDFDTNGVLYWLGTNQGSSNNYQNPADIGRVQLSGSALGSIAISHTPSRRFKYARYPQPGVNVFILDLKDKRLLCTHYTLRSCNQGWPRSCKIEGSHDNYSWTPLHAFDSLNQTASETRTFETSQGNTDFYQYFRISSGDLFPFTGLELYGYLKQ